VKCVGGKYPASTDAYLFVGRGPCVTPASIGMRSLDLALDTARAARNRKGQEALAPAWTRWWCRRLRAPGRGRQDSGRSAGRTSSRFRVPGLCLGMQCAVIALGPPRGWSQVRQAAPSSMRLPLNPVISLRLEAAGRCSTWSGTMRAWASTPVACPRQPGLPASHGEESGLRSASAIATKFNKRLPPAPSSTECIGISGSSPDGRLSNLIELDGHSRSSQAAVSIRNFPLQAGRPTTVTGSIEPPARACHANGPSSAFLPATRAARATPAKSCQPKGQTGRLKRDRGLQLRGDCMAAVAIELREPRASAVGGNTSIPAGKGAHGRPQRPFIPVLGRSLRGGFARVRHQGHLLAAGQPPTAESPSELFRGRAARGRLGGRAAEIVK